MRVTLAGKCKKSRIRLGNILLVSPLPCSDQSFEVGKPSKPKGKVLKLPPELEKKFSPQMMPRLGPPSQPMFPPQHAQPPPAYYQYMRQVSVEPTSLAPSSSPSSHLLPSPSLDAAGSVWPTHASRHGVPSPLPPSPHATTLSRPPHAPYA